MTDNNGMEDKIRKLLALAINNPNAAEAAAAMAKARELMLKHAVDEAALQGKIIAPDTDVFVVDINRTFEAWMKLVHSATARLFDARLIWSKKYRGYGTRDTDVATFVCSRHDVKYLQAVYLSALAQIDAAARAHVRNRKFSNSFKIGAANGFISACAAATRVDTAEMTALILVKSDAINKRVDEMYGGSLKKAALSANPSDYSAYNKGYDFGKSMSTSKARNELEG